MSRDGGDNPTQGLTASAVGLLRGAASQVQNVMQNRQEYWEWISSTVSNWRANYGSQVTEIPSDLLQSLVLAMISPVINGVTLGEKVWVPSIQQRVDMLKRDYHNDVERAVQAAVKHKATWNSSIARFFWNHVPGVNAPAAIARPLWEQLREIAVIASLYGHDLKAERTQLRMLRVLIGQDPASIDSQTLRQAAISVAEHFVAKTIGKFGTRIVQPVVQVRTLDAVLRANAARIAKEAIDEFKAGPGVGPQDAQGSHDVLRHRSRGALAQAPPQSTVSDASAPTASTTFKQTAMETQDQARQPGLIDLAAQQQEKHGESEQSSLSQNTQKQGVRSEGVQFTLASSSS